LDVKEPEKEPIEDRLPGYRVVREDLVTTNFLRLMSLAFNTKHKFLICVNCHLGVKPTSVLRHFADVHKISVGTKPQAQVEEQASILGASQELPDIEPRLEPYTPITGLEIVSEHGCILCPTYGKHSSILTHMSVHHKGDHLGKEDIMPVYTQRVSKNAKHRKFRVFHSPVKEDNPVPHSKQHHIQAMCYHPPVEDKDLNHYASEANLSPVVRFMNWHVGIQGKDINGVLRMMDPKVNKLSYRQIPEAVDAYFQLVDPLSHAVNKLVRKDLNTPNPSL
jgi:hypothetical protein